MKEYINEIKSIIEELENGKEVKWIDRNGETQIVEADYDLQKKEVEKKLKENEETADENKALREMALKNVLKSIENNLNNKNNKREIRDQKSKYYTQTKIKIEEEIKSIKEKINKLDLNYTLENTKYGENIKKLQEYNEELKPLEEILVLINEKVNSIKAEYQAETENINKILNRHPENNPVQGGPAQEGPAQEGPAQEGPAQGGPAQGGPAQGGPAQGGPAQEGQVQEGPVQEGPAQEGPAQEDPAQEDPAQGDPTQKEFEEIEKKVKKEAENALMNINIWTKISEFFKNILGKIKTGFQNIIKNLKNKKEIENNVKELAEAARKEAEANSKPKPWELSNYKDSGNRGPKNNQNKGKSKDEGR